MYSLGVVLPHLVSGSPPPQDGSLDVGTDALSAVIARATAREIGVQAHLAGENAFSFGLLHERAHRQAVACENQAQHAWRRAHSRGSMCS